MNENQVVIKLSINSPTDGVLRQSPGRTGIWGNYKFEINNNVSECDYWFVYSKGRPQTESTFVDKRNVFLITGEPEEIYHYADGFVKQFTNIVTSRDDLKSQNIIKSHPAQPWWVGRLNGFDAKGIESFPLDFDSLEVAKFKKTKLISVISSDKGFTAGHQKRKKFVKILKKHFGERLDVFGKGINDFNDKWEVLRDYRYHIVLENSSHKDYWTEKLADCYLSNCFPFYYGAPNISEYFDEKSFKQINIDQPNAAITIIQNEINEPTLQARVNALQKAREDVLYKHNLFPYIIKICNANGQNSKKELVTIINETRFFDHHKIKLLSKRAMKKIGL